MRRIEGTDLDVFPLCLGGNVFGWTADERESVAVLDRYIEVGGNFLDTADMYGGGESEAIIGRWMLARANRDWLVIATKMGMAPDLQGLSAATIHTAVDRSLTRLQTEHIDLYYAHRDDPDTPLEETLEAFDGLVRAGKVSHVAASNYGAPRLAEALEISRREGLTRFVAVQPHYNLLERARYEGELAGLVAGEHLACFPYFSLARGFLTGKYRPDAPAVESARAAGASAYLDERGVAVLGVLDAVAAAHGTTVAAVALAWLLAQPTVTAPIASARTPAQLTGLLKMTELELDEAEVAALSAVSGR
ncbi:MAG: aldo/keto reductase [Solirubrobacteraceae bacterium]